MKKYFILAIFISCLIFSRTWAGSDCIYVPIDIKIIKLQNTELHILEQKCINNPYTGNHKEVYFVTQDQGIGVFPYLDLKMNHSLAKIE